MCSKPTMLVLATVLAAATTAWAQFNPNNPPGANPTGPGGIFTPSQQAPPRQGGLTNLPQDTNLPQNTNQTGSGFGGGYYYGGGGVRGYNPFPDPAAMTHANADLARSMGQYNLDSAEAAIAAEEAREENIANRGRWTETYFQMRDYNRLQRMEERGPRPSPEQWVRMLEAQRPEQLSPSELDNVTGRIFWPVVLQADIWDDERESIEKLFSERVSTGGVDTAGYFRVQRLTEELLDQLREIVEQVPPEDYVAAQNFLESLAYAARQPLD